MLSNKKSKKNIFSMFFFVILFSLLCSSCTPFEKYEGTINIKKNEELQTFSQIMTLNELAEKIYNDEDLILYIYSSQCLSCVETTEIINDFVSDTHYLINGIDVVYENTILNGRNTLIEYFETPTIAVFDDGNIVERVCPSLTSKYFKSKKSVYNFLNKYLDF